MIVSYFLFFYFLIFYFLSQEGQYRFFYLGCLLWWFCPVISFQLYLCGDYLAYWGKKSISFPLIWSFMVNGIYTFMLMQHHKSWFVYLCFLSM